MPIGLGAIGFWLIFRKSEKFPRLTFARLTGLLLIFPNLMSWLQIIIRNNSMLYISEHGGGYLGAFFSNIFINWLGLPGAVVVLLAWLLIAVNLALDISFPDLIQNLSPIFAKLNKSLASIFEKPAPASATPKTIKNIEVPEDLPQSYRPLTDLSLKDSTKSTVKGKEENTAEKDFESDRPVIVEPIKPAIKILWGKPENKIILDEATPNILKATMVQENARLIEETLASFGVPGHIVEIQQGPTVTLYGLEPDFIKTRQGRTRVRVNKITALADDLALALAAQRIRIQAPVPGFNYVGIEVPNKEATRVSMIEVIESKAFQKIDSPLKFALGKNVSGKPFVVDLASLPHLLIAGTTGSGKSVCINSILTALLTQNTPDTLRLMLVDPKRVELTGYNGIPHLLSPTITESARVVNALQWMIREMDSRYHKFSKGKVRHIREFNQKFPDQKIPYIVVIIDELADIMMLAADETEHSITRLAQLARATGIHLILATQRPSTNVVTGLIKANFPARIAFAVASNTDSRVILDQPGAERLLGKGDMLYQAPDAPAPVRLQGVYVSDSEIQRLVTFWQDETLRVKEQSKTSPEAAPQDLPSGITLQQKPLFLDDEEKGDPLLSEAIDLVRREGRASITMLQRRLRIGYTRAARMVDNLEEKGIISGVLPHSNVREILDYGPTAPPKED